VCVDSIHPGNLVDTVVEIRKPDHVAAERRIPSVMFNLLCGVAVRISNYAVWFRF
jgi:hypothetical protein